MKSISILGTSFKPVNLNCSGVQCGGCRRDTRLRYRQSVDPGGATDKHAADIIEAMTKDLMIHPANLEWSKIVGYAGPIYHSLKCVDYFRVKHEQVDVQNLPVESMNTVSRFTTTFKLTASYVLMTQGLFFVPILVAGASGGGKLLYASVYLGLNAVRNIISDLSAKHAGDVEAWKDNLQHIKWDKLTDSLLTTSLAFPILLALKCQVAFATGGHDFSEVAATFLTLTMVDSMLQFISRKLRGFKNEVAFQDMLRPITGDLTAAVSSLLIPGLLEVPLLYLLLRKTAAEGYSGYVEARAKRKEKNEDRLGDFTGLFDRQRYHVPDPVAIGALSLAFILDEKSRAGALYK